MGGVSTKSLSYSVIASGKISSLPGYSAFSQVYHFAAVDPILPMRLSYHYGP